MKSRTQNSEIWCRSFLFAVEIAKIKLREILPHQNREIKYSWEGGGGGGRVRGEFKQTEHGALSKLDVQTAKHDQKLKAAKAIIAAENFKLKELNEQPAKSAHVCPGTICEECLQGQVSLQAKESVKRYQWLVTLALQLHSITLIWTSMQRTWPCQNPEKQH